MRRCKLSARQNVRQGNSFAGGSLDSDSIMALIEAAEQREPEVALHSYLRYAAYFIVSYASFSLLAVSLAIVVDVAFVLDAVQTTSEQHIQHVCCSYF
jgi:hypothetical protein